MKCKYWDCGWCYAPENVETNATQGGCFEPEYCPYRKSQMTNQQPPDIIEIGGLKYQRLSEPKPETLYDIIYEWKYNTYDPTCEELVNRIGNWLPDGVKSYSEYDDGWNDCIKVIRRKLR
jgi:hypothetical protein